MNKNIKLIIIEGPDRCGKDTLIKSLCEYFNYDNISVRHFGKPPKELSPTEVSNFQFNAFYDELGVFLKFKTRSMFHTYYNETLIWNRSHLGEYVYSQMFRNGDPVYLKEKLIEFEKYLYNNQVYLITLYGDPKFVLDKEDGHSFSKTLEQKTKEIELFKEAHDFSIIQNKLLIKVDNSDNIFRPKDHEIMFRPKDEIFKEVINFIK